MKKELVIIHIKTGILHVWAGSKTCYTEFHYEMCPNVVGVLEITCHYLPDEFEIVGEL